MGSRADLKVCHVWKWLHDLISGYAAARDRLEMMTGLSGTENEADYG